MKITLELIGPLRKYGGGRGLHHLTLSEEGQTLELLLKLCAVPISSVAFVSVNGCKQPPQYRLQEGDRVVAFPKVSGG